MHYRLNALNIVRVTQLVLLIFFVFTTFGHSQSDDVNILTQKLRNKNPYVRKQAVDALRKIDDPRVVELYISALQDENSDVRSSAAWELYFFGIMRGLGPNYPGVVEPLIAALRDKDPRVRRMVATTLGGIKDPRVIEPLIAALKDKDNGVRSYAVRALAETKDSRAVEPLITALKDAASDARSSAAKALGVIKDPRAVKPLITALQDKNVYVRLTAAEALGLIHERELIIDSLKDKNINVQCEIAWALTIIMGSDATSYLGEFLKGTDLSMMAKNYKLVMKSGKRDKECLLILCLEMYGDAHMADYFLKSDNYKLRFAGESWAIRHGYGILYEFK